jgi:hypothetical protein
MQFIVLLFGALGFSLVMVAGFSAGRQPDLVLRDAALGCLAAAIVGKWFGHVIDQAFAQTLAATRAEQQAAVEKKESGRATAAPAPVRARPAPATVPPAPPATLSGTPESRLVNKTKPTTP